MGRKPIAIGALQRYATDQALGRRDASRERAPSNGRRVAVIGAGPAGLVCAGELAARGYGVTVFDEREEVGGLVRYAIAPYRQVQRAAAGRGGGARRHRASSSGSARSRRRRGSRRSSREADAVFLGVGMGPDTEVSYPGDDLPGVWESLPFIEAHQDGPPPPVGERVVVVGGGNTAIDVAREALRLGATSHDLVYRRSEAEMPAYPHEVAEARAEGRRFQFLADPVRILGADRLEAVVCRRDAARRARR